LEGAYGKSKILNLMLRTCNLLSSLFYLKCDPIRMRCQLILTWLYIRDVASHVFYMCFYVWSDVLWIICLTNCFGLS